MTALTKNKPTEYDAFVTIYDRCKKAIHKASREDAFYAAQDLFLAQYGFCYSIGFDGFIKRYYAKNLVRSEACAPVLMKRP